MGTFQQQKEAKAHRHERRWIDNIQGLGARTGGETSQLQWEQTEGAAESPEANCTHSHGLELCA